ncbi:hypothetical protein DDW44_06525 [Streptomyces tirandamycinicus]|uniref:Uncharacterized protein n=1 Tax=Streptomyces tirandamycinicus TaxID=2174846 RepID=A0A2S1SQ08_9ACTN|nr:hypothetical protein DDW44_06525 [Streptomyces tirandamycinicus]
MAPGNRVGRPVPTAAARGAGTRAHGQRGDGRTAGRGDGRGDRRTAGRGRRTQRMTRAAGRGERVRQGGAAGGRLSRPAKRSCRRR